MEEVEVGIVELITDLATFSNGALLKTAEYVKKIIQQ